MSNTTPDVIEQVPAGGGVNKPASGTYGEKAELAQLQADLPSSDPTTAPQPTPSATPRGGGGVPSAAPSGLPAGLTLPTQRPDVPVSTPLDVPPGPTAPPDPTQRRVQLLRQLATSGQSAEVREWAQTTLEKLGG